MRTGQAIAGGEGREIVGSGPSGDREWLIGDVGELPDADPDGVAGPGRRCLGMDRE